MHLTRIKTKNGKKYRGVVIDPHETLKKDPPYICLVSDKGYKIPFFDIVEAITEQERIGVRKGKNGKMHVIIKDVDALARWLEFYEKYKSGKLKI